MKFSCAVLLFLISISSFSQVRWVAVGPGNWNTGTNWSGGVAPVAGDIVVFDGAGGANGNCTVTGAPPNLGAIQITGYTGDINLAANLTVTPGVANNTFNTGTFSGTGTISITSNFSVSFGGTSLGANVSLITTLDSSNGIFTGAAGTTFNGPVNVTAYSILLNGSTYQSSATFTKKSSGAIGASVGTGGNTFNGATRIVNEMNANFILANTTGDTFNGLLTIYLNGSTVDNNIHIAYSGINTFNNHIRVKSTDSVAIATSQSAAITFGTNGGTSTLTNNFTLDEVVATFSDPQVDGELKHGDLEINNMTFHGPQSINLRIPSPVASHSRLRFKISNCTFNNDVSYQASNPFFRNCTFNGTTTLEKTRGGGLDASFPAPHPYNSWEGGNTFNGTTTIRNMAASTTVLGSINPDIFNQNITFYSDQSSSFFMIGQIGTSRFRKNISFTRNAGTPTVQFGNSAVGTGGAILDGNTLQQVSSQLSVPSFTTLLINNTSGVQLNTPILVSVNLNLTSGVLNSTSTNFVNILDNGTSTNANDASYVDGPVRKTGNDAFVFPTGDGNAYQPISISAPATATSVFVAQYFKGVHGFGTSVDPPLVTVSSCEYWSLDRLVNADAVSVTLYWNPVSYCGPNYITDPTLLHVARKPVGNWTSLGQSAIGANNVTMAGNLGTFPSTLTLGSTSALNTLPIGLVKFVVKQRDYGADVSWTTLSETNNDYFTVERFVDNQFVELIRIPGAGNSNQPKNYYCIDTMPLPGLSYYRLKQTDRDGRCTTSDVVTLEYKSSSVPYPNPVKRILHLDRIGLHESSSITITDSSGRTVYSAKATSSIDFSDFTSGIYHLIITSAHGAQSFVIKKE